MRWTVLPLLLLIAAPAAAQDGVPACGPPREGQLSCVANRLCVCRFERGGSLTGRPDRWDWDCGILRPDCTVAPATDPNSVQPMPPMMIAPQVYPPGLPQGMPPGGFPGGAPGMPPGGRPGMSPGVPITPLPAPARPRF